MFPYSRRRPTRPRHARLAALAMLAASAGLLAMPGPAPRGEVLDLVGDTAAGPATAAGQEPTPGVSPTPAAPTPSTQPAAPGSLALAGLPVPAATPTAGTHIRPPGRAVLETPDPPAPPIETLVGYVWPIAHPRLTLPFGPSPWGSRLVDGELFHDGVDLATFCGDRIVAAHGGTVLAAGRHYDRFMGWIGDLGPYLARLDAKHLWMTLPIVVVIDDGNGYRSMYAHFGRIVVLSGQSVKAGQLIGYEGATGRATGCHLHYGLFSPWEWGRFGILPDVAARMKLPTAEIARIDPLLVLPPKAGINAPAKPKPPSKPSSVPIAAP